VEHSNDFLASKKSRASIQPNRFALSLRPGNGGSTIGFTALPPKNRAELTFTEG
jgi:hypothetical protein